MKPLKTFSMFPTSNERDNIQFLISRLLQGGISFGTTFVADSVTNDAFTPTMNHDSSQNIQCYKASGTTPSAANTIFNITNTSPFFHDAHIPLGFIVIFLNLAAIIYGVNLSSWTSSSISLECSVASVTYRLILI